MRQFLAMLMLVALAACTTTDVRKVATAPDAPPPASAKILLVQPDVQLAVLTAAGLNEPRADWSQQARGNLTVAIDEALRAKSHAFAVLDPEASMAGRPGQLLRLHEAVGQAILVHSYGGLPLPTKAKGFDWTLGEGAQVMAREHNAGYALFVTGRGSYASAGRAMVSVGAAMLGVAVPMGSQQLFASLVDLNTGRVVWFNVVNAGSNADMRDAAQAKLLVRDLLKSAPL